MLGLVFAALVGSMNVVPSFGDDDHGRGGRHDNGRYEKRGRGHDRDHDRNWRGRRPYYGYREPVYVPPPVYYAPPSPPGIDIFLPRVIIRP